MLFIVLLLDLLIQVRSRSDFAIPRLWHSTSPCLVIDYQIPEIELSKSFEVDFAHLLVRLYFCRSFGLICCLLLISQIVNGASYVHVLISTPLFCVAEELLFIYFILYPVSAI